jgi:Ser/Thr protein kinase RdoA (MazF antagonist)
VRWVRSGGSTSIAVELAFARLATEAGVHVPASHVDRDGRYLVTAPGGGWLRCYDWVDLHPLDRTAIEPHAASAHCSRDFTGAPRPQPSSQTVAFHPTPGTTSWPAAADWADVATSSAPWAARLTGRLPGLPQLCAAVGPVESTRLLLCHRDLHWEHVHVDAARALTVVDWDDMGPADPDRELAKAVFDWCCDDSHTDLDGVRIMLASYVGAGGPGRVTGPSDFSMLLASRLNYLLSQVQRVLDPKTPRRHREWAQQELELALHILPTERQLIDVLAVAQHEIPEWREQP